MGVSANDMGTLEGMSPIAYLRVVRLRRAHWDLRAADPSHDSVASIARRWGFAHLGRFAAAHKNMYGQNTTTGPARCALRAQRKGFRGTHAELAPTYGDRESSVKQRGSGGGRRNLVDELPSPATMERQDQIRPRMLGAGAMAPGWRWARMGASDVIGVVSGGVAR